MLMKVTIDILLDVASEAEAADAVSETMRGMLRIFGNPESSFIDWSYACEGEAEPHDGNGFEYGLDGENV